MASWYVRMNGKVHGPFEASQLRQMAAAGKVSRAMDVSTSSNGPWRKAGSVSGLFASIAAGAPPPGPVGRPHDAAAAGVTAPTESLVTPIIPPAPVGPGMQPHRSRRGLLIGGLCGVLALLVGAAAIPLVWWLYGQAKRGGESPRDVAVTEDSRAIAPEAEGSEGEPAAVGEPRGVTAKPESVGTFVCFQASHVLSHYNLRDEDLGRVQVWNYGAIDAIEVEHRQDERAGEVQDGQVVARNADTEVRKPVLIPHLTPGVVTSVEGWSNIWVDFGEVKICFSGSEYPCRTGTGGLFGGKDRGNVVSDEGQDASGTANALADDQFRGFDVEVVTRNDDGNETKERWRCHLKDKTKTAPFLVYRGGSLSSQSKVEEMPEKRATGRTID